MPALSTTLLWILVGTAAGWDVAQRRIPNQLVAVGLLAGLAFGAQTGGLAGLGFALFGAVVALLVLIGPFAARVMGGGDVKLAMVCGAFLGWKGAVHVILLGALAHGVVALVVVGRRALRERLGRAPEPDRGIPHAVGFAVATVAYTMGYLHLF